MLRKRFVSCSRAQLSTYTRAHVHSGQLLTASLSAVPPSDNRQTQLLQLDAVDAASIHPMSTPISLSASPPSEPTNAPTQTAAQKAAFRRNRILAKKNARMAYAAGKRSELPSQAPTEPIPPSSPATSASIVPSNIVMPPAILSSPFSQLLPNLSNSHVSTAIPAPFEPSTPHSSFRHVAALRICILTLLAAAYALGLISAFLPNFSLSAVELFASVQLCFLLPVLLQFLASQFLANSLTPPPLSARYQSKSLPFVAVRVFEYVHSAYLLSTQMLNEFCIFMFCFLFVTYLLQSKQ